MTYHDAEQYILSLSNLPRREFVNDPAHCRLYLRRVQYLLDLLGNPEKKIPHYIHVTGTSGKGSVATFLASILQAEGKKTGLTISPHPTYLRERWQINERPISKKDFTAIVSELKPVLDTYMRESPHDMVSYFDITIVIALYYFAKKSVTWAVMEVGLGGRYDATNIIPYKDVAVITNVGIDHADIIGPTKKEIAYEKAGIITPHTSVFTSDKTKQTLAIITKECHKKQAHLTIVHPTYHIKNQALSGTEFIYKKNTFRIPNVGTHQIKNACLVADIANYLGISKKIVQQGFTHAKQPLRFEIVSKHPLIILDGAHNPDKIKTTVKTLKEIMSASTYDTKKMAKQYNNIHLIVGFSNDKERSRMIAELSTLKPKSILCTRNTANLFRKVADPKRVARQFQKLLPETPIEIYLDPRDAWQHAIKKTGKQDVLLATGSIFLSGEIKKYIKK